MLPTVPLYFIWGLSSWKSVPWWTPLYTVNLFHLVLCISLSSHKVMCHLHIVFSCLKIRLTCLLFPFLNSKDENKHQSQANFKHKYCVLVVTMRASNSYVRANSVWRFKQNMFVMFITLLFVFHCLSFLVSGHNGGYWQRHTYIEYFQHENELRGSHYSSLVVRWDSIIHRSLHDAWLSGCATEDSLWMDVVQIITLYRYIIFSKPCAVLLKLWMTAAEPRYRSKYTNWKHF